MLKTPYISYYLILVIFLSLSGCGVKSRIRKADKLYEIGEYYGASSIYNKVVSKIPAKDKALKAKVYYNQAECARILNYSNAEQLYNNSIRNAYSDPIVYLRYAQVLHRNGKYDAANKYYAEYLKKDSTNLLAKNGLQALSFAEKSKNKPTSLIVKKIDLFNSKKSYTFAPSFLGADKNVLYFTSNRSTSTKLSKKNNIITGLPKHKIYSAKQNAIGKWEKPTLVNEEINDPTSDVGVCSFTTDGRIMFYTKARHQASGEVGSEIYFSSRVGGNWSAPQKLELFKDSTISVAHPAISSDNETLYFVSDNPKGSYGGKDIWKTQIIDGKCVGITNLGPDINTAGDEMFPSTTKNGTLYFASNGHVGLGGLDIFKASLQKDNSWDIINLDTPINSNFDDFGITTDDASTAGFFSSNRGESKGYDAVWYFEVPTYEYIVEGKILDENSNPISDAVVRLVSTNGLNAKVQVKKDGSYRIKVDKDIECIMMASARGYLNKEARINTIGEKRGKIYTTDFRLIPIYKPIQVENIFYDFGQWTLTPNSETGLQELLKILKANPGISIEISAHTDFVGNELENKTLSEKRAKSVVDYLISAGIPSSRLSSVGYGEEKPVTVDAQLATKYPFLKENTVLNEEFIAKLSPENQEITKQINRRTEFRVLKTTIK